MARELVGDGKEPDLFFVSLDGNIVTVSMNFETAYEEWLRYAHGNRIETTLEDRWYGTIASVESEDEGSSKLVRIDDSRGFLKAHAKDVRFREE